MAVDATGTPTPLGIPKFNVDADAPSGLGFNAAMDELDALISARMSAPSSPGTGDVPVWNGTSWVKSSTKHFAVGGIDATGQPDGNVVKAVGGVATWGSGSQVYAASGSILNSAVETTLIDQAIPAGALGTTKKVRVQVRGSVDQNTGVGITAILKIYWGGTLAFQATSGSIASRVIDTNPGPMLMDFDIANIASATVQQMYGSMGLPTTAATPTKGQLASGGYQLIGADDTVSGTFSKDTSLAQNVKVTWQFSTAGPTVKLRYFATAEVVG